MMRRKRIVFSIIYVLMFMIVVGCSKEDIMNVPNRVEKREQAIEEKEFGRDIQFTSYAKEIGFTLKTPLYDEFETHTVVDIEGNIEQFDDFHDGNIWIVITSKEEIEGLNKNDFNYYLPIEEGMFSEKMTLHHGLGEYEVSVRAPSNKGEEGMYYDVVTFTVTNLDEEIKREVEYTQYGAQNHIQLINPVDGMSDSDGSVFVEGKVPTDYQGEMVLLEVRKDHETRQLVFPVKDSVFAGDVPLYFGEGMHSIHIQTFNERDELYYESAILYANNQSSTEFAEVVTYNEYINRGIKLSEPTWKQGAVLSEQEYRIAGEIDQTVSGADQINYIIVTVIYVDEDVDSTFLIPVKNYEFDGLAYFRFGPGDYEVMISVPDMDKEDQTKFYYQGIVKFNHEVIKIEDKRALLPARGIESNDPVISQKAEEIIAGISNQREKAKAIFKFVAEHVAYDVQKAEDDIFNISDSALTTLHSGVGICQDYAFLAVALLRANDMEANFVEGDAGERHAWVEVKVDDEWIVMDPTWGAGYVHEGTFHFQYNEDYFDPDPAFLAETHTRDGIVY